MTKTEIANIALAKFREGRITTIESTTDPVAVVMNDQYDHALELLLEEHRWNFAAKRVALTKLSTAPPFGWANQYALPADCIRLKDVNGEDVEASSQLFELEGSNLLTNDDTVTITYVAKITDTNLYSPSFVEALSFKLASITCGRLTGDTELAIMLDKQYNYALSKAIHNDTKADGSRDKNLMQRLLNSSAILGGNNVGSGSSYPRTGGSSGTVAAHKHELTDLLQTSATDGQTIVWNDTEDKWEAQDAGGDVSTDAIFDAAGDLVIGTGADTAAKLPIGANGLVLKSNGTTAVWDAIAGTGDVVGDTSSVDNAITRFDGTTGKAIQNSGATIDDTGNLTANNFTGTSSGDNTGDQDLSTYQVKPTEGAFVDGDKTKLDGIEASADVTDTTNVTAAGALMDSEVTNLAQVKAFDTTDYAAASHTHVASTDIVATGTPSATTYLQGDDTWAKVSLTTGVTGDLPYANLVPATGISKLVGRGAAAGAGDMEEITLGTGLTMVGTTLSSSGGGGGSVSELSDLSDVNTSTPTSGFALIADGVDFESRAITAADVSDFDTEVGNNSAVALNTAKVTNVSTNLSYTAAPTIGTVTSSDGTDATLTLADATNAGLLSPADFTKLGNIGRMWYSFYLGADDFVPSVTGTRAHWTAPAAGKIWQVAAGAQTNVAGANLQMDVEKGGTTIITGILEIAIAASVDDNGHSITVPTSFAAGDIFDFDIDQAATSGGVGVHIDLLISWD